MSTTPSETTEVKQTPQPAIKAALPVPAVAPKVAVVSAFVKALKHYISVMPPKAKIGNTTAGSEQMVFWTALRRVLSSSLSQEAFNADWNVFLWEVSQNRKGCFSESSIFCYPIYWTLGTNEYTGFRTALHIAMNTCNPETRREDLKMISMGSLVNIGFTPTEQQRLFVFYS